jgi:hypothetical protein
MVLSGQHDSTLFGDLLVLSFLGHGSRVVPKLCCRRESEPRHAFRFVDGRQFHGNQTFARSHLSEGNLPAYWKECRRSKYFADKSTERKIDNNNRDSNPASHLLCILDSANPSSSRVDTRGRGPGS